MVTEELSVMPDKMIIMLFVLFFFQEAWATSSYASPENCNNPQVSYFECATLIQRALKNAPDPLANPNPVFRLAALWDAKFESEYEVFRRSKQLKSAKSDYELIMEEIEKQIDPREIVKEKIAEKIRTRVSAWFVKRFKQMAPVVRFLGSRIVSLGLTGVGAFLKPSEIATDWDERRHLNDQIQDDIANKLMPLLKPDWRYKFEKQVGPVLERPR